jgi:hypothetical protein
MFDSFLDGLKQKIHRKRILCQKISTNYLRTQQSLANGLKKISVDDLSMDNSVLDKDPGMALDVSSFLLSEQTRIMKNANESRRPFLDLAEQYQNYVLSYFPTVFLSEKKLVDEFTRSRVIATLAELKPEGVIFPTYDLYN